MKIDWKVVAQSMGYRKLKQSYQNSQMRSARFKNNSYELDRQTKQFKWIISRATHYAHHLNTTLQDILNCWEAKRTYNWESYYTDHKFPKLGKTCDTVKPKLPLNYYRKDPYYKRNPESKRTAVFKEILRLQKKYSLRKGSKARWDSERKKREAKHREYLKAQKAKLSP